MTPPDLHRTATRAFAWVAGAMISILFTMTASLVLSFTDTPSIWFERTRLVCYVATAAMIGGALSATAFLRRETMPPAAHRKEDT